mmetsp:Transcript_8729/g.19326  ORF Transcript_8729/g.19326 Transcript_8729/m.19326 type:complete len:289 (+) Transcript_8729:505-1371(+)
MIVSNARCTFMNLSAASAASAPPRLRTLSGWLASAMRWCAILISRMLAAGLTLSAWYASLSVKPTLIHRVSKMSQSKHLLIACGMKQKRLNGPSSCTSSRLRQAGSRSPCLKKVYKRSGRSTHEVALSSRHASTVADLPSMLTSVGTRISHPASTASQKHVEATATTTPSFHERRGTWMNFSFRIALQCGAIRLATPTPTRSGSIAGLRRKEGVSLAAAGCGHSTERRMEKATEARPEHTTGSSAHTDAAHALRLPVALSHTATAAEAPLRHETACGETWRGSSREAW